MLGDQTKAGAVVTGGGGGFPDLLANIHGVLSFVDRLAFAAVFRVSRDVSKPERLFSLADRRAAAVRATDPALCDHAILGSSRGWLFTADGRAWMHLVNPVIGEQHVLPAITTIPCLHALYGGSHFVFQVVLSASPHPGNYAAMLILGLRFGAVALEPSGDGVEDTIHHKGQFYSITYSGAVEAWEQDADASTFTSTVGSPRLANADGNSSCRKYLVAAPGGRLIAVLNDSKEMTEGFRRVRRTCSFKVQVLDDEAGRQWKLADDIRDAAMFVGANSSLCGSTREHPELKAGCVYFTDNELGQASLRKEDPRISDDGKRGVGVFSLEDGTVEKIEALGKHESWPPPVWFTPSIL